MIFDLLDLHRHHHRLLLDYLAAVGSALSVVFLSLAGLAGLELLVAFVFALRLATLLL
jgi:hypothetical protein